MPKTIPKAITSLIDPNHPVINTLGRTFGGHLPGRRSVVKGVNLEGSHGGDGNVNRSGVSYRTDIIDEKLCDDVLNYLAPTLEPYKGCTIIDAHPGACVWSTKLHEFLKPKRHILMEPEERYVEPFIQPLLDKKDSTFRYTPHGPISDRAALENFKTILSDKDLLTPPAPLPEDDPRLRQLDTSVLVTGNIARLFPQFKMPAIVGKASQQAHRTLQQLTAWSWLSHNTFHSQGLVRMLWWVPDQHKSLMMPHLTYQNSSLNLSMQMGAKMAEVVGVEPAITYAMGNHSRAKAIMIHERMPWYDAEMSKLVRQKMKKAGIKVPKGRSVLGQLSRSPAQAVDVKSPVTINHKTVKGLESAIKQLQDHCNQVMPAIQEASNVTHPTKVENLLGSYIKTIKYPQSLALGRAYQHKLPPKYLPKQPPKGPGRPRKGSIPDGLTGVQSRIVLLLDLNLRIINLEANYAALAEQGKDVSALKDEILQLDKDIHSYDVVNRAPIPNFIHRAIADHLAFFSQPPLLLWDRRPYEPLKASLDSFWPHYPLALLDITPTGRDLTVPDIADRFEATRTTSELIKYMFTFKTHPIGTVLDKIAPNAAQDLIPQAPALADPRKGGRLDPTKLRVRMLNEEMVEGLVRAWFEWPFKPRLIDLALAADGGASEGGEHGEGESEVHEITEEGDGV